MDKSVLDIPFDADADVNESVSQLIALIEALTNVITNENQLLADGFPASLAGSVPLKTSLSLKLDRWTARVHAKTIVLEAAAPHLREQLAERSRTLSTAMQENVSRIKSAIDATSSRVNAIMSAIREQTGTDLSYHADGKLEAAPRPPAPTAGLLV